LRPVGDSDPSIHVPVPEHAARLLARLLGGPQPFEQVQQLQAALAATRDSPREVRRALRITHLLLLGVMLLLYISLITAFDSYLGRAIKAFGDWVSELALSDNLPDAIRISLFYNWGELIQIALLVLFWMVWAFLWRGGLTLRAVGLNLVRGDGRKAS